MSRLVKDLFEDGNQAAVISVEDVNIVRLKLRDVGVIQNLCCVPVNR
jgi:hypothetical protein